MMRNEGPPGQRSFTAQDAADYEARIPRLVPGYAALHRLAATLVAVHAPIDARILVVGAGAGAELAALAESGGPEWRFDAVDPSAAMLDRARERLDAQARSRVRFHATPLSAFCADGAHHLALSVLVSHFIADDGARAAYFADLHCALRPGGVALIADLSAAEADPDQSLYRQWLSDQGWPAEEVEERAAQLRARTHPLTEERFAALLRACGFGEPTVFWRALDFRAWRVARR